MVLARISDTCLFTECIHAPLHPASEYLLSDNIPLEAESRRERCGHSCARSRESLCVIRSVGHVQKYRVFPKCEGRFLSDRKPRTRWSFSRRYPFLLRAQHHPRAERIRPPRDVRAAYARVRSSSKKGRRRGRFRRPKKVPTLI